MCLEQAVSMIHVVPKLYTLWKVLYKAHGTTLCLAEGILVKGSVRLRVKDSLLFPVWFQLLCRGAALIQGLFLPKVVSYPQEVSQAEKKQQD